MKRYYYMLWMEEEKKWAYHKEGFSEYYYKDKNPVRYLIAVENGIIIDDTYEKENIGKLFADCYDKSLWLTGEFITDKDILEGMDDIKESVIRNGGEIMTESLVMSIEEMLWEKRILTLNGDLDDINDKCYCYIDDCEDIRIIKFHD